MWEWIIELLIKFLQPKPVRTVPESEEVATSTLKEVLAKDPLPEVKKVPMPTYQWDTREQIRHSIRVICDEMGMTVELKNTMCATIYAESEFNLHARNYNKNDKGVVTSTDYGLCQWNDYYHGDEISVDQSLNNPEKAVRLMGKYWVLGERYRRWWIAYKNDHYKQFLTLTQHPM